MGYKVFLGFTDEGESEFMNVDLEDVESEDSQDDLSAARGFMNKLYADGHKDLLKVLQIDLEEMLTEEEL